MGKELGEIFLKQKERFLNTRYKSSIMLILTNLWDNKKPFSHVLIFGIIQSILFLTISLFLCPIMDILTNPTEQNTEVFWLS